MSSLDSIPFNELLRELLRWLAARYPLAHPASVIARRLGGDLGCKLTEEEVLAAASFLHERGMLNRVKDPTSTEPCWKATADGVAHWRNGNAHLSEA